VETLDDVVRGAETEAIFRDVNETLAEQQTSPDRRLTALCECSNDSCAESIELSERDYERVRSEGTRFLVCPDHVTEAIEVVVERNPDFWVIEKVGTAGAIAEETDPRA
jgi:uncharacterized Fe-S cluster-containing radical SAM superfamily protein